MTEIRKRLEKLEADRKMEPPRMACLLEEIERAALAKLSAVDRHLFQGGKTEDLEHTQAYKDMLSRWETAFAAASWEAGVPYLDPSDRGWL